MTNFVEFSKATGRLVIADKAAVGTPILLDTNHGTIYTPDGVSFIGSVNVPARSVTSSGVDGTQNTINTQAEYYIGTPLLAGANMVRGLIRFDGVANNNLWRDAKGSHLEHHDAIGQSLKPQTDSASKYFLATQRILTPMINNLGHLVLHERVVSRPRDPGSPQQAAVGQKTIPAVTVLCRLHCDFWHGNPLIVPKPDAEMRSASQFGGTGASINKPLIAGYGYSGRRLVAVIYNQGAAVSSVTIGGQAAAIHDAIVGSSTRITIASVALSSNPGGGETVDVVVNWSGAVVNRQIDLYAVRQLSGAGPTIAKVNVASGNAASVAVNVPQSLVGIVASAKMDNFISACTWINADASYAVPGGFTMLKNSAVIQPGLGAQNVTANWAGGAGEISVISVLWG